MVMGVGFIIGLRISAILFAGAVAGWLVLVPLALFLNPQVSAGVSGDGNFIALAVDVWFRQIRPVGRGNHDCGCFLHPLLPPGFPCERHRQGCSRFPGRRGGGGG